MILKNKSAIITGGGKGIGKAIALLLSRAGARVVITGRNTSFLEETAKEIITAGGQCLPVTADVSRPEDAARLVKEALDAYGGIDILVNNAGVGSFAPLESVSPEEYDRMMDTNVKGSFLLSREVIPFFKKQKSGHLVMIASDVSRRVFANGAIYCASKHAQHALAEGIRKEVRPYGVRVGVVYPGLTDTFFGETQQGTPEKQAWLQPMDVAHAVMYMLQTPTHVLIDEITLHPMVQDDY
jgi:NADP-dependent 3-hydroxy acid dehydrogenase YdfG